MAKSRPRFGQGHAYTAKSTRAYETALAWEGKRAMVGRKPLTGALKVTVHAWMPIPKSWSKRRQLEVMTGIVFAPVKPDADNVLKVCDGLNKIAWIDDSQIVIASIIKQYSHTPRLEIEIEEIA